MSEHEELESSVAAWVLGAMEADEVEMMHTHIEGCAICRETAARLGRTVAALPLDVEDVEPPARLRERILTAAAASRDATEAPARPPAPIKKPRRTPKPRVISTAPRGLMPVYTAAAAVLFALLIGVVAGDLIGRGAPAPPSVARSVLAGHDGLAAAKATVINLRSDGVALVDFSGLPQLDSGKVYEVWLITASGRADPAGVFVPDSNGSKVVLIGQPIAGYTEMAVTSEVGPAGTLAPTQQPELYGNLA
jgi:anti-sigma-K factor RskA